MIPDAMQAHKARVVAGWHHETTGTVVVLEDGTYLERWVQDGKVEWREAEPVARTFRAAVVAR